jgi:hypothetical protein
VLGYRTVTALERGEGARSGPPPSPGLVHTVTKQTRPPLSAVSPAEDWAAFELTRRLARMRRRTITRARLQAEEVHAVDQAHQVELVTFTYAPGHAWRPQHIREAMDCYRQQSRRDGHPFRYEWVAELQLKRMRRTGESAAQCLHYHAIVWSMDGYTFPHPDTRGWWGHGMTNVEIARNPVGYLAKYASKGTEGEALPRGARVSGGGGLSDYGNKVVRWWLRPRYVRLAFPDFLASVARAPGGGWVDRDTGEFLPAPAFDLSSCTWA